MTKPESLFRLNHVNAFHSANNQMSISYYEARAPDSIPRPQVATKAKLDPLARQPVPNGTRAARQRNLFLEHITNWASHQTINDSSVWERCNPDFILCNAHDKQYGRSYRVALSRPQCDDRYLDTICGRCQTNTSLEELLPAYGANTTVDQAKAHYIQNKDYQKYIAAERRRKGTHSVEELKQREIAECHSWLAYTFAIDKVAREVRELQLQEEESVRFPTDPNYPPTETERLRVLKRQLTCYLDFKRHRDGPRSGYTRCPEHHIETGTDLVPFRHTSAYKDCGICLQTFDQTDEERKEAKRRSNFIEQGNQSGTRKAKQTEAEDDTYSYTSYQTPEYTTTDTAEPQDPMLIEEMEEEKKVEDEEEEKYDM
jgi:hypothetical protein